MTSGFSYTCWRNTCYRNREAASSFLSVTFLPGATHFKHLHSHLLPTLSSLHVLAVTATEWPTLDSCMLRPSMLHAITTVSSCSVFWNHFCLLLQNQFIVSAGHRTFQCFLTQGWALGHCGNANNYEQNCCLSSALGSVATHWIASFEDGLQFCIACTDPSIYIWECHVFTSAAQVLVILLASAMGLKDFQSIRYWQVKVLYWRNMKWQRS